MVKNEMSCLHCVSFVISMVKVKSGIYGQILPMEEIEKIFEFINSVVRLPCICRKATMGSEQRYCYGLSMEPGEETAMGKLIKSIGADYLTGYWRYLQLRS